MSEKTSRQHIEYLQRTLDDPSDYRNWLMLGWTAEDPRVAFEFFQEALCLKPNDPVCLDSVAWTREAIAELKAGRVPEEKEMPAYPWLVEPPAGPRQGPPAARPIPAVGEPRTQPTRRPPAAVAIRAASDRKTQPAHRLAGMSELEVIRPAQTRKAYHRLLVSRATLLAWAAIYMAAIAMAELMTIFLTTLVSGLVFHGVVLLALVFHGAFSTSRRAQRFLLAMAFAPLIRIVSLSIPLQNFPQVTWYLLAGLPLFISAFILMRYADFDLEQVGLTGKHWYWQVLVGLLGIGLGYLEYIILKPNPIIPQLSWATAWIPSLILLIFTGLLEELIFRGVIQRAVLSIMNVHLGIIFVSILFAILHVGYRSMLDVLFVFGVGAIFSYITFYTRSILGVTLAHGLTNISLYLIFPFIIR